MDSPATYRPGCTRMRDGIEQLTVSTRTRGGTFTPGSTLASKLESSRTRMICGGFSSGRHSYIALALSRFSMLAVDLVDLVREIDVNPLVGGKEIAAVDALFVKA